MFNINVTATQPQFPPQLAVGSHVWSGGGYTDHGPKDGPKVDIPAKAKGVITYIQKLYVVLETALYVVRWDDGQESKHYANELFCIGRFNTLEEFEAAMVFLGEIELRVGPQGGFQGLHLHVEYDGVPHEVTLFNREFWIYYLEPLVKRRGVAVRRKKLPRRQPRKGKQ